MAHMLEQYGEMASFASLRQPAWHGLGTVFEEENVLIRSYTNAGNTESLGAELNSNFVIGPKIKMFVGGSLYHYRVAGDIFGYKENNKSTEHEKTENHEHGDLDNDMNHSEIAAAEYQCPMKCEGEKTYHEPGSCSVCKMDLKEVKKEATEGSHEEHENEEHENE